MELVLPPKGYVSSLSLVSQEIADKFLNVDNMSKKDSFVLYASQADAISDLTLEQKGILLDCLFEYVRSGVVPTIENSAVRIAFKFISIQIDRDSRKYELVSEKRREAVNKRWKNRQETNTPNDIQMNTNVYKKIQTDTKHTDNDNDNDNVYDNESTKVDVNKKKDSKEKERENSEKSVRFVKPKIEEISEYIKEKSYHFTAESFYNFYESKGWMIGKNKMKDWKAACRTWESKRKEEISSSDDGYEQMTYPSGINEESWNKTKKWMVSHVPRIMDLISPHDFMKMRAIARHKSHVLSVILCEINNSSYQGDVVKEFSRLSEVEPYKEQILRND